MEPNRPSGTPGRILERLKRSGPSGIPELARAFSLSPESVRAHVRTLSEAGLVEASGTRSDGRGRPRHIWSLTRGAERLFPRREGELLRGLAIHLREAGHAEILTSFLDRFSSQRRDAAMGRLEGLRGHERLEEVARILTEEGYMAEIQPGTNGAPARLRLCHCPMRELVEATRAPCKAEVAFVRALVGRHLAGPELTRVEHILEGGTACAYAVGGGR
ncbi:MAG TPA: winged helix-turn-helix transcriptional regulator [Longimicrobiales bacterium]|nr:winged helix-turn-helix transcriptional regulator [Longimicrobiales bacterium]